MQQLTSKNPRSAARPMIWLILAFHLMLGGFLYYSTSVEPSSEPVEIAPPIEFNEP